MHPALDARRIGDERARLRERRDAALVALHRVFHAGQPESFAEILEDVEHRPPLEGRLDDGGGALRADDRREPIDEPRDVFAFELTGDGQHVSGQRDGFALDDVGHGEHIESRERRGETVRVGQRRDRIAADHQQRPHPT